jgi:hypothetical protein
LQVPHFVAMIGRVILKSRNCRRFFLHVENTSEKNRKRTKILKIQFPKFLSWRLRCRWLSLAGPSCRSIVNRSRANSRALKILPNRCRAVRSQVVDRQWVL